MTQRLSKENIYAIAAYCLCVLYHLVRKGIGLPQCQLLIVEGVAKYAAHYRNVLEEEKSPTKLGINGKRAATIKTQKQN